MENQQAQAQAQAHSLMGYRLLGNQQQPTIAIIAFQTKQGDHFFAATREILEQLAESFQRQASKMPRNPGQN
jgi:hypothetical protein